MEITVRELQIWRQRIAILKARYPDDYWLYCMWLFGDRMVGDKPLGTHTRKAVAWKPFPNFRINPCLHERYKWVKTGIPQWFWIPRTMLAGIYGVSPRWLRYKYASIRDYLLGKRDDIDNITVVKSGDYGGVLSKQIQRDYGEHGIEECQKPEYYIWRRKNDKTEKKS